MGKGIRSFVSWISNTNFKTSGFSGKRGEQMRYIGLQVKKGDHAIFLRKDAVEIKFDDEKFIVVPQAET